MELYLDYFKGLIIGAIVYFTIGRYLRKKLLKKNDDNHNEITTD